MINKLRKKLIAINLISVGVVFFISVVLLFGIGYSRIGAERRNRMTSALLFDPAEESFASDVLYSDLALAVYDKQNDSVTWYAGSDFKIDLTELETSVHLIVDNGDTSGIARFRLSFRTSESDNTVKIVFNDLDSSKNSLMVFLAFALLTLVMGIAIYFVISNMLANVALKPLEESWKQQRQFVADASHELKTPLSVIMANTEIIASHGNETVDSQMRWIQNTREESARMAELVASLLFLAKSDDGLKVELANVNLSDCVFTTVLGQEAVLYENGKKFDYNLENDIHVLGNESQLKQLVSILLDNANKYSTDEGNVAFDLALSGKHAVITVSNDSDQLTDEQLSHLFDRFYTVDESRNSTGNGLGLSIAKTIVDTHGGSISVGCNNGRTTFVVQLPVVKK